jgi:uncharacterized RDD family membrane protein YckC
MTAPAAPDDKVRFARRFVTPEGADLGLVLGSAGDRAAAFLLDLMLMVISLVLFTFTLFAIGLAAGLKNFEPWGIVWLLGFFVLRNGWFILFEVGPRAATPGKRAVGLRVAARDGGRLTTEAVLVRNFLREIEVFLPIMLLLAANTAGDPVEGWVVILALVWTGCFLLFPMFNRDRLRLGDVVAGTWVVRAPRVKLLADLSAGQGANGFAFSREQLSAYGVKELQVLEAVLRARDKRTMTAVADRIRGKIGWYRAPEETDAAFLSAYYAGLRGRLEHRLLFGHRRKDKFDAA